MSHITFRPVVQILSAKGVVASAVLILCYTVFSIIANSSLKISATSEAWRGFLLWQIVGNLAGFITVLALTGLLRFAPLHVAYPVTAGLAVIGVQVVAARWFFGESISTTQWLGTLLVVVGIVLIGGH